MRKEIEKKQKHLKHKLGLRGELKPGDLLNQHKRLAETGHLKHRKHHKTVKIHFGKGKYQEGEEIKAIRALNEMHEGKHEKHHKHYKHRKHEKHYKGDGHDHAKLLLKHRKHEKHAKHEKHEKHRKNFIAKAIKHPGALHRELGIKAGHKIPASKLRAAAKKPGVEGRRAKFAETLEHLHHKRSKHEKHR